MQHVALLALRSIFLSEAGSLSLASGSGASTAVGKHWSQDTAEDVQGSGDVSFRIRKGSKRRLANSKESTICSVQYGHKTIWATESTIMEVGGQPIAWLFYLPFNQNLCTHTWPEWSLLFYWIVYINAYQTILPNCPSLWTLFWTSQHGGSISECSAHFLQNSPGKSWVDRTALSHKPA